MRRSGVRIPLAPPQADIRSGCRFFVCLGAFVRCLLLCCLWLRWCSGRRRARPPARLGDLTSFGAAPRSPPVPSGPSGALHTSGAWSLFGSSTRRQKPGQALPPLSNLARNSPVTLSNIEFRSLELQRFRTLLKLRPIELRAKLRGGTRLRDDACSSGALHCLRGHCTA